MNGAAYEPVYNLGLLYFKESLLGAPNKDHDTRLAAEMLEKANEISPNNRNCLQVLQQLYTQAGNEDEINKVNNKLKQLTNQ